MPTGRKHKSAVLISSSSSKLAKSLAARAQYDIGSDLLETRILLQRALGELSSAREKRSESGDDDASTTQSLLDNLREARISLCKGTPSNSTQNMNHNVGEDKSDLLQQEHEECKRVWKKVLDRRYSEIRIRSGGLTMSNQSIRGRKFLKEVEKSFWDQVESTVDREELLKKGSDEKSEEEGLDVDGENLAKDDPSQGMASIINAFDDSNLYQQMLRDFLSMGGGGTTSSDNQQQTSAEAAAERLRRAIQKKKRNKKRKGTDADVAEVDRRASKGRKIRHEVIPKLQNFVFPVMKPAPAISDDEWFRSLFGGVIVASSTSVDSVSARKRKMKKSR